MSLSGKVALVTGSNSGIGKACAERLAREGAAVIITGRNVGKAQDVAEAINAAGGRAIAFQLDVSVEENVQEVFSKAVEAFGGLDIVVSNAGIQIVHPFDEFPFEDWRAMMAVHADGAFLVSRAAFREMKRSGKGGQIIFMGSAHSHVASLYKAPYCFSKHGLLGLARTIAKEGGPLNIHSYVVCPGFVRTPLVEKQIPEQAALKGISEEEVVKNIMLRDTVDCQFTTFDEVADVVSLMAHDVNGSMTGQSLVVSHGWGMD